MQQRWSDTGFSLGSGSSRPSALAHLEASHVGHLLTNSEWQRPWENVRDRTAYAMGFAPAFATDAFLHLSRMFTQAVASGEEDNQPAFSAEGTIRLDDVYHLHCFARSAHDAVVQSVGAITQNQRVVLQRCIGLSTVITSLTWLLVHLAFINPVTQLSAAQTLSQTVYGVGNWSISVCAGSPSHDWQPTVVRLEVLNATSWQVQLSEAFHHVVENRPEKVDENVTQGLGALVVSRFAEVALWSREFGRSTRWYEITCEDSAWLEVRSKAVRETLGVRTVHLQVGAEDPTLFGPWWSRQLLSWLHLYDVFVLHAVPIHFLQASPEASFRLRAAVVTNAFAEGVELAEMHDLSSFRPGLVGLWWFLGRFFFSCVFAVSRVGLRSVVQLLSSAFRSAVCPHAGELPERGATVATPRLHRGALATPLALLLSRVVGTLDGLVDMYCSLCLAVSAHVERWPPRRSRGVLGSGPCEDETKPLDFPSLCGIAAQWCTALLCPLAALSILAGAGRSSAWPALADACSRLPL